MRLGGTLGLGRIGWKKVVVESGEGKVGVRVLEPELCEACVCVCV